MEAFMQIVAQLKARWIRFVRQRMCSALVETGLPTQVILVILATQVTLAHLEELVTQAARTIRLWFLTRSFLFPRLWK